jgi:hypothetical protein
MSSGRTIACTQASRPRRFLDCGRPRSRTSSSSRFASLRLAMSSQCTFGLRSRTSCSIICTSSSQPSGPVYLRAGHRNQPLAIGRAQRRELARTWACHPPRRLPCPPCRPWRTRGTLCETSRYIWARCALPTWRRPCPRDRRACHLSRHRPWAVPWRRPYPPARGAAERAPWEAGHRGSWALSPCAGPPRRPRRHRLRLGPTEPRQGSMTGARSPRAARAWRPQTPRQRRRLPHRRAPRTAAVPMAQGARGTCRTPRVRARARGLRARAGQAGVGRLAPAPATHRGRPGPPDRPVGCAIAPRVSRWAGSAICTCACVGGW